MQKNILILGLGAFGFAIAKHLGENNPDQIFYASEVNSEIFASISKNRTHPYFFPGVKLSENIELISNTATILPDIDIIISVIPCQFVGGAFSGMKDILKNGVTILNLSKGINNDTLETTSEKLADILADTNYTYAYLAGGMIAEELVEGKKLGADIVTKNEAIGKGLRNLFASKSLDIHLIIGDVKTTELYAALKNIIALILGYYEGLGNAPSSLGYYLTRLLEEISGIIQKLGGNPELRFTDYALGGDIIATCFGASRNRQLGNMLGEGKDISTALKELADQRKIAEGYETLKGVYTLTKKQDGFLFVNSFSKKFLQ